MQLDDVNIILITIDALRADHLSCLGYHRKTTPNIDRLARQGVSFTHAFANGPTTQFSFPSVIASLYPLMLDGLGLPQNGGRTIAEVLKDQGYSTAAFHSNPYLSVAYNYHRGFETFRDPQSWSSPKSKLKRKFEKRIQSYPKVLKAIKNLNDLLFKSTFSRAYKTADEMNKEAISWTENHDNEFFLWLHYMDVHHPYFPHNELLKKLGQKPVPVRTALKIYRKLSQNPRNIWENVEEKEITELLTVYDSEIMYTDRAIGELIDELGDGRNTIGRVTSDHGEEFGEHNGFHRMTPYNEMLHVPLIIKAPGLEQGVRIKEQASLIDLGPTIVDLLGLPKVDEFEGESLLPIVKGEKKAREAISEYNPSWVKEDSSEEGEVFVCQYNGWKLILRENGEKELYDLHLDPLERNNLIQVRAKKAKELEQKLAKHISRLEEKKMTVSKVELDEILKERLRDLGYL